MNDSERNNPQPGTPSGQRGTRDPTAPPREKGTGLPRMVLETRTRMGPDATPERVARELQDRGVDTTVDAVRNVWDVGHAG